MGIWKKIKRAFGGVDDALEDAAGEAWDFIEDSAEMAVALLREHEIGASVLNTISAVADKNLSNSAKRDAVVDFAMPLIRDFADNGKLDMTGAQVKRIAVLLVESLYTDFKNVGLKAIIAPLIRLLKSVL